MDAEGTKIFLGVEEFAVRILHFSEDGGEECLSGLGLGLGLLSVKRKVYLRGRKSVNRRVLNRMRKSVDNEWSDGRLGCLFSSPCYGNSSVLMLLRGGLISSAIIPPCGWWSDDLGVYPVSAVSTPMCGREKKVWWPQERGHLRNSRKCGPDLTREVNRIGRVPNSEVWVGHAGHMFGYGS